MSKTWVTFEDRVRGLAQYLWGRPCNPQLVGGVKLDGVVKIDDEISMFVEMTEEKTLGKVRTDVAKLVTAKNAAAAAGYIGRGFCVVNGNVTQAMIDAGKPNHIKVLSVENFSKLFFDFGAYETARSLAPFGSSINPVTGETDPTEYVSVRYSVDGKKDDVSSKEIAEMLRDRRQLILLGEYGSGKSRCVREVFKHLSV